jgi:hypothetical protein
MINHEENKGNPGVFYDINKAYYGTQCMKNPMLIPDREPNI